MSLNWGTVSDSLSAAFFDGEISWKPTVTKKKNGDIYTDNQGNQIAGCTAHIDARSVMNRLDAVVGPENWSDTYEFVPLGKTGCIMCKLTVLGVTKSDVGVQSDTEPQKGAFSDALKRAAVKFGIARYLYGMDGLEWLSFDGYKITSKPNKHWERAGVVAPQLQKVHQLGGMDIQEISDELLRAVEKNSDDGKIVMGAVVQMVIDAKLYKDQNEVVIAIKTMKEDGQLESLVEPYIVAGSTVMESEDGFALAALLVGLKMA